MKNLRMLIVSASGTWQRMLQKSIEAYYFVDVVAIVSDSLTALQLANINHPDLMLIDSSIPLEDAVALVQNVKRDNPRTRSIAITDTTQQRRRVVRSGVDYTVTSYSFEAQIGEVLHQVKAALSELIENNVQ